MTTNATTTSTPSIPGPAAPAFDPHELIGRRVRFVDFRDPLIQRGIIAARAGFITGLGDSPGRVHVTFFLDPHLEAREQRHTGVAVNILLLRSREDGFALRTATRTAQNYCYPHIDPINKAAFFKV
ncbi:hypothetical protein [Tolypothrix sp. VBCCA 56010]|uniref:hypothetical protein n=1 Tax=Tolypothrix sp. VBCCA 56010 TaxID=3137731 RepID=UPI003D7E5063